MIGHKRADVDEGLAPGRCSHRGTRVRKLRVEESERDPEVRGVILRGGTGPSTAPKLTYIGFRSPSPSQCVSDPLP